MYTSLASKTRHLPPTEFAAKYYNLFCREKCREIDTMHNTSDDNMARRVLTDYNTFGNRINLISFYSGTYS